jgi:hypothetical protein
MQPQNIQVYLQLTKIILQHIYDVKLDFRFKKIFIFFLIKSFHRYLKHFHQMVKMFKHRIH